MAEVYQLIGCSKQNISYWSHHSYSTQSRKSVIKVIENAREIFALQEHEAEALANSAGLSLNYEGGDLLKYLNYYGKIITLSENAMISERMLRLYRHKTPTKQTLTALEVALGKRSEELERLLHKYGYCLSDSIISDVVVKWYLNDYNIGSDNSVLYTINDVLSQMGLPLLMTRQI